MSSIHLYPITTEFTQIGDEILMWTKPGQRIKTDSGTSTQSIEGQPTKPGSGTTNPPTSSPTPIPPPQETPKPDPPAKVEHDLNEANDKIEYEEITNALGSSWNKF